MKRTYEMPSVEILQMRVEQMIMTSSVPTSNVEDYFYEILDQE